MRSSFLLLVAVLAISEACAEKPNTPTNFQVALIKPDTVVLGWQWDANVNLQDVTFKAVAKAGEAPIEHNVTGSLQITLNDLKGDTAYEVTITASLGEDTSDALSGNFNTLKEGYPAPVTVETVLKTRDVEGATYTTSWAANKTNSLSAKVTRFVISYCLEECDVKTVDNQTSSIDAQLSYYTEYKVTVAAEYDLPVGQNLTVNSEVAVIKTVAGKPGPVRNFFVDQTPDTLDVKISWTAPEKANGNIKSYILQLTKAAGDGTLLLNASVPELSYPYQFLPTSPFDDQYGFKIAAVNDADDVATSTGTFIEIPFKVQRPKPPQNVNLKERTANSLKLEIQRESVQSNLIYYIKDSNNRITKSTTKEVLLDGFQPFMVANFEIACCIPLDNDDEFCGDSENFKFTTNVGPPSKVQYFAIDIQNFLPVFSWKTPANPAGPLGGYQLVITNKTTDESKDVDVGRVLNYEFKDAKDCTEYEAVIMAYNTDLDTGEKVPGRAVTKSFASNCDESPDAPQNLAVADMQPDTVVISWTWSSAKLNLDDIKFKIELTTDGDSPIEQIVEGSLQATLSGLKIDSTYEVTITALLKRNPEKFSDPLNGTFKTLTEDWPTPANLANDFKSRDDDQAAIYTTSWSLDQKNPLSANVTRFEITYNATRSVTIPVDNKTFSFEVPVLYNTEYTVTVSAVYELPGGQTSKKTSTAAKFTTVMGKPGPVSNFVVQQTPDTLDLDISWSLPEKPNANIQYYMLQLEKASDHTILINKNVTELKYSYKIAPVAPVDDEYIFRIAAVSNADDETIRNGTFLNFPYVLMKPEPPEILRESATANSLNLRILRSSAQSTLFFMIRDSPERTTKTGNRTVMLDGFTAFTEITIDAMSCLPLDGDNNLCGNEKSFAFMTNVGLASEVQKLYVGYPNDTPKLTWEAPYTAAGPIDGYLLNITDKTLNMESFERDVGTALEYLFDDAMNCTEYEVSIMAYNLDLDTKEKVLGTPLITTLSTNCDDGRFPAWGIALIVIAVLGAVGGGGGAFYYFKMRK